MKLVEQYNKKYADVSKDPTARLQTLIKELKISAKDHIFEKMERIRNIKWKRLEIVIWLDPKACPRPRQSGFHGGKFHFYVKGAADNRKLFEKFLLDNDLPFIYTPIKMYTICYSEIPSSMKKDEKILAELDYLINLSKPDYDNLAKPYPDMMQYVDSVKKALIMDDKLIYDGRVRKTYSSRPRVVIDIRYMEEFDCDYNKKKILKQLEKLKP